MLCLLITKWRAQSPPSKSDHDFWEASGDDWETAWQAHCWTQLKMRTLASFLWVLYSRNWWETPTGISSHWLMALSSEQGHTKKKSILQLKLILLLYQKPWDPEHKNTHTLCMYRCTYSLQNNGTDREETVKVCALNTYMLPFYPNFKKILLSVLNQTHSCPQMLSHCHIAFEENCLTFHLGLQSLGLQWPPGPISTSLEKSWWTSSKLISLTLTLRNPPASQNTWRATSVTERWKVWVIPVVTMYSLNNTFHFQMVACMATPLHLAHWLKKIKIFSLLLFSKNTSKLKNIYIWKCWTSL